MPLNLKASNHETDLLSLAARCHVSNGSAYLRINLKGPVGDCAAAARYYFGPRDSTACAVLFSKLDCGGRLDYTKELGFGRAISDLWYRPESVLVRKGCVFYGYENDYLEGMVLAVDAHKKEGDVVDVSELLLSN